MYLFEKPLGILKGMMMKKIGVETLLTCSEAFTIYKSIVGFLIELLQLGESNFDICTLTLFY